MGRHIRVVALLCFCLGIPQAARSAPILDQAFVPIHLAQPDVVFGTMYADLGLGLRAQTFTVGLNGVLTSFEVLLDTTGMGAGERTFDILGTTGGVPDVDSAPLASVAIPFAGDSTGFYAGSLGVPLSVGVGGIFAIADRGLQGDGAFWVGHYDYANDPAFGALLSHYPGGAALRSDVHGTSGAVWRRPRIPHVRGPGLSPAAVDSRADDAPPAGHRHGLGLRPPPALSASD